MLKVLTVFGTRPEAIKMAPLIAELERHPGVIDNRNCLTGQHKDMVAPLIDLFGNRVDHDLKLMRENQTLEHITVSVLQEIGRMLREEHYDLLLVQGDTTTSMAAAYRKVPSQFEAAEQARRTRHIILAGPLDLVQGGTGLVARLPVYLPDADGKDRFWGLVSAVIDADRLFRGSGLMDGRLPVEIAIRGRDAKGSGGEVFFGRPELFGSNPVLAASTRRVS